MTTVVKRGGKEQKFNPLKLKRSITGAAREAKVSKAEKNKLVREVANPVIRMCRKRKTIRATMIRKMVVSKLNRKSKEVAAAWRKYERRHRKR